MAAAGGAGGAFMTTKAEVAQARQETAENRVQLDRLKSEYTDLRVAVEGLKTETKYVSQGVDEIKQMLRQGPNRPTQR